MTITKIIQKDYTSSILNYQFKLPLEMEVLIEDNDPVRLLSVFVEGLELTDLYNSYQKIKKNQVSPRQMFKIILYAAMNHIYSSRDIETACKRDINFMYLLEGKPAPDHSTIARFLSAHFSQCSKKTLAEVTEVLLDIGEICSRPLYFRMEESRHKISEQISRKDRCFCGRTGTLLRDPFYLQWDNVWYQDIEKNTEKTLPDQGRRGDYLCSWMRQKAVKTAKRYQRIRDLSCEIQRIQSKDPYLRGTEQLLKNR